MTDEQLQERFDQILSIVGGIQTRQSELAAKMDALVRRENEAGVYVREAVVELQKRDDIHVTDLRAAVKLLDKVVDRL